MALQVTFFDFKKKENSTEQPDTLSNPDVVYYTEQSCILKEATSMISPTLVLELGFNPVGDTYLGISYRLNYVKIPEFNRYYFVDDWTYFEGRWMATCRLDVLASWKTEIGNTSAYVLRSSSNYDENIIDGLYTAHGGYTKIVNTPKTGGSFISKYFESDPVNGIYVLGIQSPAGGTGFGSGVTYYAFSKTQLVAFLIKLLDPDTYDIAALLTSFNPMSFITTAKYFPINATWLTNTVARAVTEIQVSFFNITGISGWELKGAPYAITNMFIDLPVHPQIASIGRYMKNNPYSKYSLFFPPFGEFALDSASLYNFDAINLTMEVDLITGKGFLRVLGATKSGNTYAVADKDVIYNTYGDVGVDIPLSAAYRNYYAATTSLIPTLAAAVSGEPVFAMTHAATGIINSLNYVYPPHITIGGAGSILDYYDLTPYILLEYINSVSTNASDRGRPLCQIKTLNTLSGYIQCMDGEVKCNATATELESLKSYMENGFFYE